MLKVNFKNAFKVILTWDFGNIFCTTYIWVVLVTIKITVYV